MQITGDLNDKYLIMSMISRHVKTLKIPVEEYQIKSLCCFVNVLCLLADSENMLKLKGKNARDIYSSRFGIDGCSRSSLEVLKKDGTSWISLLTLAKTA